MKIENFNRAKEIIDLLEEIYKNLKGFEYMLSESVKERSVSISETGYTTELQLPASLYRIVAKLAKAELIEQIDALQKEFDSL